MSFDLGDGNGFGSNRDGVGLLTREQIMRRAEEVTRDEKTGQPLVIIPRDSDLGGVIEAQRICGFCRNWDLELGQVECRRQSFWPRMLREEKYRQEWFDDPGSYGLCHVFEGRLIPSLAPAVCSAEDMDSGLRGKKGATDKKACPHFRDKRTSGSRMSIGKYHKNNLEH